MSSSFRPFVGILAIFAAASCSSSSGGGFAAPDSGAGVGGTGAVGGADSGVGGGGTGGGVACTVDSSDPSAIVRALSVEGGTLVEAPAPASIGSHPSVTNGGCSQIAVDRG